MVKNIKINLIYNLESLTDWNFFNDLSHNKLLLDLKNNKQSHHFSKKNWHIFSPNRTSKVRDYIIQVYFLSNDHINVTESLEMQYLIEIW